MQALVFGEGVEVVDMDLGVDNRGQITIPGLGSAVSRVVLAVSGLTRFTTEPAPYSYGADVSVPAAGDD